MKLWIARSENGILELFHEKPTYHYIKDIDDYMWVFGDIIGGIDSNLFPEVTFENSPMEVELKIPVTKLLTRDYFANHNWEIIIPEPDENGFVLWEARWVRSMEEGSPYYSDLTVTNMMYKNRFCISGKTSEGSVQYLMAYTEEDLENILKVLDIYDYYKKES